MSEVKRFSEGRFSGFGTEHPQGCWVRAAAFDRVTAERDAALGREAEALAQLSTWDRVLRSSVPEEHKHPFSPVAAVQNYIGELEQRLTAADERADVLEGLLARIAKKGSETPGFPFSLLREARLLLELKTAEGGGDDPS